MALVLPFKDFHPQIDPSCFLAPNVSVIGDVVLGEGANLWYGTVARGDMGKIRIERRANVQDMCVLHMTKHVSDTLILEEASIGHSAIIHGAVVESGALVGMGCIVMDNARIGEEAIVGAGSLVTQGKVIPPRTLALGRPARVIRELTPEEAQAGRKTAERYWELAQEHGTHLA